MEEDQAGSIPSPAGAHKKIKALLKGSACAQVIRGSIKNKPRKKCKREVHPDYDRSTNQNFHTVSRALFQFHGGEGVMKYDSGRLRYKTSIR